MGSSRVVWLAGLSCGATALALSASAWSSATVPSSSEPRPAISAAPTVAVAADPLALDRLARYQAGAPRPTQPSRSPFTFATAPPAPMSPESAGRATRHDVLSPAILPVPPPPSLVGIVTLHQRDGGGRTAVFTTSNGTTHFGRVDEIVAAGPYRIRAIESDSVTLVDTVTGEISCIPLR